ncbi:MAG: helix-turn-helix transcriptional regulator [Oscillospiraceae bacterium]|nr:helix-turn-helix transcriptional regulator [Oscillospiraceae bacterium]
MEELTYFNTIQPFFVTASESCEKEIVDKYGIVCFFRFISKCTEATAVPDGSVDMIFRYSEKPYAYVSGTVMRAAKVYFEKDTEYFCVRFLPGFNPILGENAMSRLIENQIPFRELISDEKMLANIFAAHTLKEQSEAFMRSYMSIFRRIRPMDKSNLIVRHSMNIIFGAKGNVSVQALADDTGYSARYLNQCFRSEIAMSPKQFAKIIRFQSVLNMIHSEKKSLTDIAAALGYFDQAHFIKDFKECTGFTPKKYQQFLKREGYFSKITEYYSE